MGEGPRREHRQIESYAQIEGLFCEETALLELDEHERTADQHQRLRAISAELDAIWGACASAPITPGAHVGQQGTSRLAGP